MTGKALCADCGVDTRPCTGRRGCRHTGRWDDYLVRNSLWAAAGMERGFLCVGCLERRLGHRLRPADFIAVPVNDPGHPWHALRLISRLTGT